ncbi:MAG: polyphosphate polymerase domain-containing protein [Oscillospiraceae bacterium]|nr:polyphosphate polymerase domain-containing protein [Oscillospiraceae bacterium]
MNRDNRRLRHELKYILPKPVGELLQNRLRAVMKPDGNSRDGSYRVTSLYLDDLYRASYYDKLAGINQRRKFRVRAYGLDPGTLRLEVKRKDNEYVYKTAAPLTLEQYGSILKGDFSFMKEYGEGPLPQAMEELMVSEGITRPRPVVLVDYFREAWVHEAGDVRVTFDTGLATCRGAFDMFKAEYSPVLGDAAIMEIKYGSFMPSRVIDVFSGVALTREAVSKYALCMNRRYILNNGG